MLKRLSHRPQSFYINKHTIIKIGIDSYAKFFDVSVTVLEKYFLNDLHRKH